MKCYHCGKSMAFGSQGWTWGAGAYTLCSKTCAKADALGHDGNPAAVYAQKAGDGDMDRKDEVVGYDTTKDALSPTVLCPECGDGCSAPELHYGEEWGGKQPRCSRCREKIEGLDIVPIRSSEEEES